MTADGEALEPSAHPRVRERLQARQDQLLAQLHEAGAEEHGTAAGDISEFSWRRVLRAFLPHRYRVGHGFVVDAFGGVSEQQDIILYDRQYSPALLSSDNDENAVYVTAESVYAVFEAKPQLNRSQVFAAAKKAHSVRSLQRTRAGTIETAHGRQPTVPHQHIVAGVLTATLDWQAANLQKTLSEALSDSRGEYPGGGLTLGIALDQCVFRLIGGHLHIGIHAYRLISLLMELLSQLQPLGTAGRADHATYSQALTLWDHRDSQ